MSGFAPFRIDQIFLYPLFIYLFPFSLFFFFIFQTEIQRKKISLSAENMPKKPTLENLLTESYIDRTKCVGEKLGA